MTPDSFNLDEIYQSLQRIEKKLGPITFICLAGNGNGYLLNQVQGPVIRWTSLDEGRASMAHYAWCIEQGMDHQQYLETLQ